MILLPLIPATLILAIFVLTEASAETLAFSNGATLGTDCESLISPFDVDDSFGNATDPDDISAISTDGFIYYVGRVLTDHTNVTNTADVSWGCEASSPTGGLITSPATTGGSPPSVTISDTGTLSTTVVPNSLLVTQNVTGSNPSQPLGTKGIMTITLDNRTGGSVKNITVDATLPAGYVMDNSYGPGNGTVFGDPNYGQPNHTESPAYVATYGGFIDTFTRDDFALTTSDPLDDIHPTFTLTSTTTGEFPAKQVNMLRHGDVVTISFGIIMVDTDRFDKKVDLDLAEEITTGDATDPASAVVGLTNNVIVKFDSVDPGPQAVQSESRNLPFLYDSDPEDLDVSISDSLFILTNDINVPLDLNVLLTNNGGHDADDYTAYVSFRSGNDSAIAMLQVVLLHLIHHRIRIGINHQLFRQRLPFMHVIEVLLHRV